jgi:hypothetical protein
LAQLKLQFDQIKEKTMPPNFQSSLRKIVLLSLSTVIISGSAISSLWVLGKVCSQVITGVTYYYNAMLKQELMIP